MDTQTSLVLNSHHSNRVRLTDDVLAEIYYILVDIDRPRGPKVDKRSVLPASLGWIVLTHVCRQWRYVGINLAALWANIACVFPPNVKAILERAKDAPLTVNLTGFNNSRSRWLNVSSLESMVVRARIYKSDTDETDEPVDEDIEPETSEQISESWRVFFAGRTLPLLETLELTFDPEEYQPSMAEKYLNAPALRSLTTIYPRPIIAPHLTSLRCAHGYHWHWQLLLDFIRLFPLLEQLYISEVACEADSKWWQLDETEISSMLERAQEPTSVHLSHMKTLVLEYCGPHAWKLLQHLDLPVSATLKIYQVRDESLWEKILSRPEMTQQANKFLSVFESEGWEEPTEKAWFISLTKSPSSLPPIDKIVDADGSMMTAVANSSKVPSLLDAVPSQVARNIEELVLGHGCEDCDCERSNHPLDYERLSASLAHFSNVAVLHLYCLPQDFILSFESRHLFPNLHTAILTCSHEFADDIWFTEDIWWDSLRGFLSARKEAGRQLGRLVFRGNFLCHTACTNHQIPDGERDLLSDADRNDMIDACLQRRRINLELQAPLVGEIMDERKSEACSCRERCNLVGD